MMETCASVCNSGDVPASADHGLSSTSDFVAQQYWQSHEVVGHDLLSDVRDLLKVLDRPKELVQSAQFQQQAMQAALAHAEQSLQHSRSVLVNLAGKLQNSNSPMAQEGDKVVVFPLEPSSDVKSQPQAPATGELASPSLPSDFYRGDSEKGFALSQSPVQQRRVKTGHTLLSKMGPTEEFPALSEGIWPFLQVACRRIVSSTVFEFLILAVIVVNSAVIGIESQLSVNGEVLEWGPAAENVFLAVYSMEIIMRLVAGRLRSTCDGWFVFDALLVLSSYVERVIEVISGESAEQLMLLRLLRLIRLVRTFRMVRQVRPLWRLVHGLLTSLDTVLSTFLLLALVLYVFGVLGMEIIATNVHFKNDPVTNAILSNNFSSLGLAMITLAQFVTMDSIAAIYLPLVRIQPWLMLYFTMLIFIISISVMNLVTAALVEGTLENARLLRQEEERLKSVSTQHMLPEILELFDEADADGSGELAIEEMRQFEESGHVPYQILDRASVNSMTELFNVLDVDKSGVVTREEFAEGLLDILLRDVSVASLQQMKILRSVRDAVARLEVIQIQQEQRQQHVLWLVA